MSELYQHIYRTIRQIPPGRVASYGYIAQVIGKPRAARLVGWALRALPPDSDIPWQRVINRHAQLSILHPVYSAQRQADLLRQEGLQVLEINHAGFQVIDPPWWEGPDAHRTIG